jgi:hypothetical protein
MSKLTHFDPRMLTGKMSHSCILARSRLPENCLEVHRMQVLHCVIVETMFDFRRGS